VTEKPVPQQANLRSPPTRNESEEISTSCRLQAPCHHKQGAYNVIEEDKSARREEAPSDNDFETQEAMRNFQAYLGILREWDEEEKRNEEPASTRNSKM
jgi:hypothetical protein